jgi:hypothetical protein
MSKTEFFTVRDFDRLQHRGQAGKTFPWIKLYSNLLDDPDFERLEDNVKFQYIGLLLLARKSDRIDHSLPRDSAYLQRKLALTSPLDLEVLQREGFITPVRRAPKTKQTKDGEGAQRAHTGHTQGTQKTPGAHPSSALDREGELEGDRELDQEGESLNLGLEATTTEDFTAKNAAQSSCVSEPIPEELYDDALTRVRQKDSGEVDDSTVDYFVGVRAAELGHSQDAATEYILANSQKAAEKKKHGPRYARDTVERAFDHVAFEGNLGRYARRPIDDFVPDPDPADDVPW